MEWPEPRYVLVAGSHLAVYELGDGPVTIVATPGYFFPAHLCAEIPAVVEFLERASAFARVLVFDHLGVGLSDPLPSDRATDVRSVAAELLAVVEDAGGTAQIWTYGVGGLTGLVAAALAPEMVQSVTVVSTNARVRPAADYPFGLSDEVYDSWINTVGANPHRGMEQVILPSGDDRDRDVIRRGGAQSASPANNLRLKDVLVGFDARPFLPDVRCPVMVVHAAGDTFLPVEGARDLAERLPDARLEVVDSDNHVLVVDRPTELADLVEDFLTGAPRSSDRRRVLATVVFTDVVSSTERATSMGDGPWRSLLDDFDSAVRAKVMQYGGTTVKFTGDGHLLTFDAPGAALRCARELQKVAGARGLQLRTGIHTGEVELLGDDVAGTAVVVAARVMSLAGTDEILATSTVVELVEGSDHKWDDRGEHVLKGIPRPKAVFALG